MTALDEALLFRVTSPVVFGDRGESQSSTLSEGRGVECRGFGTLATRKLRHRDLITGLALPLCCLLLVLSLDHAHAQPVAEGDTTTESDEGRQRVTKLAEHETPLTAVPKTPGTSYLTFSGTRFQPTSSQLTFAASGGAVYATALPQGGFSFSADFDLPVDATIAEVVFFVVDDDAATNMSVSLRSYNPETDAFVTLESASSSGASSSLQIIVLPVDPPVQADPTATSYRLRVAPGIGSIAHLLRGARIEYVDPLLFSDGFESGDTLAWSQAVP